MEYIELWLLLLFSLGFYINRKISERKELKKQQEFDEKYYVDWVYMPHMGEKFPVPIPKNEEE